MAPFFMDVWLEMADKNQENAVSMAKKTLFFIPSNDDVIESARHQNAASKADSAS